MRMAAVLLAAASFAGPPGPALAAGAADDARLEPFQNALEQLEQKYYDESLVGPARLLAKAEEGVVDSLDPESLVLDGAAPASGGADPGLIIGVKDGMAWILDVLDGSPAAQAGLKAGDRLMRINGEPAYGKKRLEVERALMGPAGSTVVLLWEDADDELREASVGRQTVQRPGWRRVTLDDVELIQIFRLDPETAREVREFLAKAPAGTAGAALDLRRCASGDLDAALDLAGAFVAPGHVLALGQGAGPRTAKSYVSEKKGRPVDVPLILLIGPGTEGPAELLASALKEQRRSVTVGKRTFGFVARQKDFPLVEDGKRRLRLTVERFLTPGLVSLTGTGVGADLAAEVPGPRETLRLLERHGITGRLVDRLIKLPPAVFDPAGVAGGELKLTAAVAKGKSVAEQRGEFEQAIEIALRAVLRDADLEIAHDALDQVRLALISAVRVELARRLMKPDPALAVALREDPEVALGLDTLKALKKLAHPMGALANEGADAQ